MSVVFEILWRYNVIFFLNWTLPPVWATKKICCGDRVKKLQKANITIVSRHKANSKCNSHKLEKFVLNNVYIAQDLDTKNFDQGLYLDETSSLDQSVSNHLKESIGGLIKWE